jgi:hypothetical protein
MATHRRAIRVGRTMEADHMIELRVGAAEITSS